MNLFWRTVYARAYPRLVGNARNWSWVVVEILLPLLGTLSMGYVFRALHAPQSYYGFVILGGALLAFWQNVLWSMAAQMFWDRDGGNLELFILSPTSLVAIMVGMAFGAIYPTLTRAVAVVVGGSLLFGVHYSLAGIPAAIGVFLLELLALYAQGMLMGAVYVLRGREAQHISNALQEPVMLASGVYFPVRGLGSAASVTASMLPLALGLDALRQLLLPGQSGLVAPILEAGGLALQVIVFGGAAWWLLDFVELQARRTGRLVSRGR